MIKQLTTAFALIISAIVFSQVGIDTETPQATLDVVGAPADITKLDGIIAPRISGEQLRAKTYTTAQQGALVYVTEADTSPAGQTIDVTTEGYYYFNGTKWVIAGAGNIENIYNSDGALTNERTLDLNGTDLTFQGSERITYWDLNGRIHQEATNPSTEAVMGFHGGGSNLYVQQWYQSNAAITASDGSTGLLLATHFTQDSAPISFNTSPGGNTMGLERMRITGEGNIGINTSEPTEKLDNEGITRLRNLPLNLSTNAINTLPDGSASTIQNQTFTATRTLIADDNGVVGYVNGVPTDAGTSKVLVLVNAPGTQNIRAQVNPNAAIAQFTNESIDVNNAWTNNEFKVPSGLDGVYIMVMQSSNTHTSTGTETPTWNTMAFYERSTDGGITWTTLVKDTYSNLAGTIVDNGNTLYWTGFLNAGDKVRVRFSCNATTNNIVDYAGLSITKLAQ